MFAYRECRPRALALAGAAEVQFLTAGNVTLNAGLAMNARVGFETVPAGAARAAMRIELMPVSTSTSETKKCAGSGEPIPSRGREAGQPPEKVIRAACRQRIGYPPISKADGEGTTRRDRQLRLPSEGTKYAGHVAFP
jgi:hypothetical protein